VLNHLPELEVQTVGPSHGVTPGSQYHPPFHQLFHQTHRAKIGVDSFVETIGIVQLGIKDIRSLVSVQIPIGMTMGITEGSRILHFTNLYVTLR